MTPNAAKRYGEAALYREIAALTGLSDGRHAGLCHAAFVIGQLVGAGAIGCDEAERALFAAALANGYVKKRGTAAARSTIRSGLGAGATKPRNGRLRPSRGDAVHIAVEADPEPSLSPDEAERERAKPQRVWRKRRPIAGTIAETYLRQARGYGGLIPPTLAFLSARDGHEPALVAAFGIATEPEPGLLAIDDDAVTAVQLVKLKPDGSSKADAEPNKIIIGKGALGSPIVLAPPNDLLGLAIAEGLEDALSIHEATGLGAWASGGAGRMSALADAVPSYVECVSIFGHDDDNGRRGATELGERIRARGVETILKFLGARAST